MVLKITPKQRTKINALVRKTCCNCYKGNCLLLDDGEETKCVQLISRYGIYCNYFLKAVLPAEKELYTEDLTAKRNQWITARKRVIRNILKCAMRRKGLIMKTINNTKIIGIDHGYGNMKTANCCFPTGITAYDHEPLFTADMLVYGGRYYLIGEGHKEFAPDKIKDEDYYVLTLAAIAKELKTENLTEAHIVIAAGLPLTWTSGQKADFKEYLMKNAEVEFTYKKADYHLYIDDVRIYPQGYAAIASFATTLKGVNLIADIGNGTMNTLYMINGKPQQGKMFTEKFGTYQCTLAVREAFMQKTQREINDAIIDEVLITGTANIAPADLKIIKSVAAEYVRDIFRRLREHGYDENTMTLYVTGGGGCLVKNFYKFSTDRVKFVEDICAAAKGYEYLAEAQMKAEAKG